ncbi:MAG: class I SAM-dependent methyltransferase [Eubacteriales bacterium]|jgi:ubiquinone/menaquinone biosynthesis C-methylase UbiE|nr:class I SAM-dependent methyltransferase [Eubacteriales bacterium]
MSVIQAYGDFAAFYDRLMADVDYTAWADYLTRLLQAGGVAPGESILDCACGTGEITLRLHKAGYRMTGADCSERMLEIAQQKARKAGARIAFVQQQMQNLSVHKPVSAITCVCDGVNYLLSSEDVCAFFTCANRALKTGGLLLFDASSAYKLEHILGGRTFGEDETDCTYLWQNCFDPKTRLLEMRLVFFTPDERGMYKRFDERHVQRAHTHAELTDLLERAGFAAEGVFDAFTKDTPKPESERIQFVARKKSAL